MWQLLLVFLLIFIDIVTKVYAKNLLVLGSSTKIIKKVLSFTLVKNRGAAFGIMQNFGIFFAFFSFIVIIILTIILFKLKTEDILFRISCSLIIAGSFGNLIDRVINGYVIDFIELDFINFPVFNIADISITIGGVLMSLYLCFKKT